MADPRTFMETYPPPVIFDEVQYAPDLLPYIKEKIDADRHTSGQFLLTGSQNLSLTEKVTESLAGRAAMLRLLPLSRREAEGRPQLALPWESERRSSAPASYAFGELWNGSCAAGTRSLPHSPVETPTCGMWHSSYIQTYLERDMRRLRQVGDLTQYRNFLRVLAARSAQLLNLTDVARDLGGAVNTIKAWIAVLEATYQVIVLRPYFANAGKRLVKTPKVYFADVGTLCHLAGLRDPEHAAAGPMGSAIMGTAVLSEIVKTLIHRGSDPHVYFWRTSAGSEVDFVVETGGKLVPIEVKLSATPRYGRCHQDIAAGLGSRGHARVRGASRATYGCRLAPA